MNRRLLVESRPLTPVGAAAVVSLGLVGLLLVAISVPPLFNETFGERETRVWDAMIMANGLLYLSAAVLIGAFRSRLGIGLGLVLAMTGFAMALSVAFANDNVARGLESVSRRQLFFYGGLAGVHAVAFAGALDAAQRWGIRSQPSQPAALSAAILFGLGLAVSLGSSGGESAIVMSPTDTTDWFRSIQGWLPLAHFIAAAAIALRGRLALPFAASVSAGGVLVALAMLVSLAIFRAGPLHLLGSVALRCFFLVGYAIAAGAAFNGWRDQPVGVRRSGPGTAPPPSV